jgi:hypothetical protein
MPFYLVERYVPSISEHEMETGTARLSDAAPGDVRHLLTVLLPGEDTCFSVFQAPNSDAVELVNQEAGLAIDRIVEATVFGPLQAPARRAPRRRS